MGTVHLVFGPQGAGKSTYARQIAQENSAARFSIDEWMHQLYGPDLPQPLNYSWIMERVRRCERRIWATACGFAELGSDVVLDLGFMKIASRAEFMELARAAGLPAQLHYISAPRETRKRRVLDRNIDQGETFTFEVTSSMFDFMETQFEQPTASERASATVMTTG